MAHPITSTVMTQVTPPGLEAVPVSCYSESFRTWAFDNDLIAEFDAEDNNDEYRDEDDENFEDHIEHCFIDLSPDNSKIGDPRVAYLLTVPLRLTSRCHSLPPTSNGHHPAMAM